MKLQKFRINQKLQNIKYRVKMWFKKKFIIYQIPEFSYLLYNEGSTVVYEFRISTKCSVIRYKNGLF
jgi:hypothetical protein